ncbi:uncharacterized [Tachysurus ichikawai]
MSYASGQGLYQLSDERGLRLVPFLGVCVWTGVIELRKTNTGRIQSCQRKRSHLPIKRFLSRFLHLDTSVLSHGIKSACWEISAGM